MVFGFSSFIDNIDLNDVADVVTGVAGAAGAYGKGQNVAKAGSSTQGFASLSPEVQEYMTQTVLPKIQQYGAGSYQGVPMRALNAEDTDPIFGSRARQDYSAMKTAEQQKKQQAALLEQVQAAQDRPSDPSMDSRLLGLIEASRLANMDMGKMGWNQKTQQQMQIGNQATGAGNYEALLQEGSEGYENPYGAGTFDRENMLRLLGEKVAAGNPLSTASSPHVQMTNEDIQNRLSGANDINSQLESGFQPTAYRPDRMTIGSLFGGSILPALGSAAFTGGMGLGGLPWQAADAASQGENFMNLLSATKQVNG